MSPGDRVGERYLVQRLLGEGGMSSVYEVADERLGGRFALKVLSEGLSSREAEILSKLSHPHLPKISDLFEHQGRWCMVLELVEGPTLEQVARDRGLPLPEAQVRAWGVEICQALEYIHAQGLVYRDLKPSNLMLAPSGRLMLIDFGIARFYDPGKSLDTQALGSPGFAAPEQYGQQQSTPVSDLYALGAVLHHLATGHEPWVTPFRFPPARSLNPALTPSLEALLTRALALEPAARFAGAAEMARALAQEARQESYLYPLDEPEAGRFVAAAGVAVAVTGLAWGSGTLLLPLAAAGFLPLWLGLLRWDYRTSRERAATEVRVTEEELSWSALGRTCSVPWDQVRQLSFRRTSLLGQWLGRVDTLRGSLEILLEDCPGLASGRALAGGERLCREILSRARLQAVPGQDTYRPSL